MNTVKGWLVAGLLLFTGLVGLCACGCDDEPTRSHRQTPQEPKDYPVYFCNSLNSTLWIFHPATKVLDSVVVPYAGEMRGVTVSADGRLLYFAQENRVLVVTADSLRLVKELPYPACFGTSISPDNSLLVIMDQDFYILGTSDWSVVYLDTSRIQRGVFSHDSQSMFACGIDTDDLCWVRPNDSSPVLNHRKFPGSIIAFKPTPDGKKIIMSWLWHFISYDFAADSILRDIVVYPGHIQLGLTPDGLYAFYGNPDTPYGDPGTLNLYVFDVTANCLVDSIDPRPFLDSAGATMHGGVGPMVVTPDARWLVALNYWPSTQLIAYDLERREPVYFRGFGGNHDFLNIAVQHDR